MSQRRNPSLKEEDVYAKRIETGNDLVSFSELVDTDFFDKPQEDKQKSVNSEIVTDTKEETVIEEQPEIYKLTVDTEYASNKPEELEQIVQEEIINEIVDETVEQAETKVEQQLTQEENEAPQLADENLDNNVKSEPSTETDNIEFETAIDEKIIEKIIEKVKAELKVENTTVVEQPIVKKEEVEINETIDELKQQIESFENKQPIIRKKEAPTVFKKEPAKHAKVKTHVFANSRIELARKEEVKESKKTVKYPVPFEIVNSKAEAEEKTAELAEQTIKQQEYIEPIKVEETIIREPIEEVKEEAKVENEQPTLTDIVDVSTDQVLDSETKEQTSDIPVPEDFTSFESLINNLETELKVSDESIQQEVMEEQPSIVDITNQINNDQIIKEEIVEEVEAVQPVEIQVDTIEQTVEQVEEHEVVVEQPEQQVEVQSEEVIEQNENIEQPSIEIIEEIVEEPKELVEESVEQPLEVIEENNEEAIEIIQSEIKQPQPQPEIVEQVQTKEEKVDEYLNSALGIPATYYVRKKNVEPKLSERRVYEPIDENEALRMQRHINDLLEQTQGYINDIDVLLSQVERSFQEHQRLKNKYSYNELDSLDIFKR